MDATASEETDGVSEPTFCIRFTIGNSGRTREGGENEHPIATCSNRGEGREGAGRKIVSGRQDARYCDHSPFTGQNETSLLAHQIDGDCSRELNLKSSTLAPSNQGPKKSYRFVEPQNHKSALFVNLGTVGAGTDRAPGLGQLSDASGESREQKKRADTRLFISPDLNAATLNSTISSTPTSSVSSSPEEVAVGALGVPDDGDSVFELLGPSPEDDPSLLCEPRVNPDGTMSHSCNFMHWMSATKRRASSTNPASQPAKATSASSDTFKDLTNSTTVSGEDPTGQAGGGGCGGSGVARRASSSDGLNQAVDAGASNLLAASGRSASRNHLAISDSVETVRELDQTQTNRFVPYIGTEEAAMRPLGIRIDSPSPPLTHGLGESLAGHPVSLDAILQIDDLEQAEEECRRLEAEAHYWEQRVEEMERKQFAEDVPRTLVENIIKHRKELRDLDFQLYQHQLDSEESDQMSCEEKLSHVLNLYEHEDGESSPSESDFRPDARKSRLDARMCLVDGAQTDGDHRRQRIVGHHRESHFITDFSDLGGGQARANANSKFGSQIKPGQENTVDILSAVPPSSSLQRRQYLSKASSGTDSSEYSQLPSFHQHKHRIVHRQHQRQRHQNQQVFQQQHHLASHRISRQQDNHHLEQHHHQQQQQQHHHHRQTYMQVDACAEASEVLHEDKLRSSPVRSQHGRLCSSPIRPNHFKSEFKPPKHAIVQDSSSTASSSSPQ